MPKTKDRVAGVAGTAKPYVERALNDEELRDHVKQAYAAAREIYDELIAPRSVVGAATRVAADEDLRENLRTAVDELRAAAYRLQGRKEHHPGRAFLLMTGVVIGLLYNPFTGAETRRWLKNTIFGEGDQFGFDSTTPADNGSGAT